MFKFEKIKINKIALYGIVVLVSILLFFAMFGVKCINPLNIDWITKNHGLYEHYIKWDGYRHSAWSFPLMGSNAYTYPDYSSYITRDNVVLLELVFKLFSGILPTTFQYFGPWGLFCFVMQGILSIYLFSKLFDDNNKILLSSIISLVFTALMGRMNYCNAMSAQWLILLMALFFIDYVRNDIEEKKSYIYIALMAVCAALISPFYSIVLLCFLTGCIAWDALNKTENSSTKCFGIAIGISYLMIIVLGGIDELRKGISFSVPVLNLYVRSEDTRIVYVGLGELLLMGYVLYKLYSENKLFSFLKKYWKHLVSIAVIALAVATIIVLKPAVKRNIVSEPGAFSFYFTLIELIVVSMYLIYIPIIYMTVYVVNKFDLKKLSMLVAVVFLLQFDNVQAVVKETHGKEFVVDRYDYNFVSTEFWDSLSNDSDIKKLAFIKNAKNDDLVRWALDNNKKIIAGAFSNDNHLNLYQEKLEDPSSKTLFVFDAKDKTIDYMKYDKLHYYRVDGYIFGCKNEIDGAQPEEVDARELCTVVYKMNDGAVQGGFNVMNRKILLPDGLSYGPYCNVSDYNYMIAINGDNLLDNTDIEVHSDFGETIYEYDVISESDEEIILYAYIGEATNNLEVIVSNSSDEVVSVDSYTLTPMYE